MVTERHFLPRHTAKALLKELLQARRWEMHKCHSEAINTLAEPFTAPQGPRTMPLGPESLWNVDPGGLKRCLFFKEYKVEAIDSMDSLNEWIVSSAQMNCQKQWPCNTFALFPKEENPTSQTKLCLFFIKLEHRSMRKRKLDLYSKI